MKWLTNYIRKEEWSPYVAGILLGIVGLLTVVLANSLLGASGAFESLAGYIGKAIDPKNVYFNFVMPAGITSVRRRPVAVALPELVYERV